MALNVYYEDPIENSVCNINGMIKDINAKFFHCLSTDAVPQHQFCPKGVDSWCKYQKALAKKEAPPKHKPKISNLAKYIRPDFVQLMNWDLLTRCTLGATQNQN